MDQRVIVGLQPGAEWGQLKRDLQRAGAHTVSEPSRYQPDAVVATLGPKQDVTIYTERVRQLPGVRYAEPDAMSETC